MDTIDTNKENDYILQYLYLSNLNSDEQFKVPIKIINYKQINNKNHKGWVTYTPTLKQNENLTNYIVGKLVPKTLWFQCSIQYHFDPIQCLEIIAQKFDSHLLGSNFISPFEENYQ